MFSQLKTYKKLFLILVFCFVARTGYSLEIFYDAQLNAYVDVMSKDLIAASRLKDVKIYLAKSKDINAFATENKEIIFFSGLVWKMDNANQFQGVLAHELAHLVSDHHLKKKMESEGVSFGTVASVAAGLGAIIMGAPQVGMAAIVGGNAATVSRQLDYSRQHENEADTIGLRLLKTANLDSKGFAEFFSILEKQEAFYGHNVPEFLSTHPSTTKRRDAINRASLNRSRKKVKDEPFDVFKTKLFALTEDISKVKKMLDYKKDSLSKNLALSVVSLRESDFDSSKKYLKMAKDKGLRPQWYYETLGQIDFQQGNLESSIKNYKKAQKILKKDSWIINFQIAESYFALKNKDALNYYFKVYAQFPKFSYTLKRIGDFYSLNNKMTLAHIYFVEYYLEVGNKKLASKHFSFLKQYSKKEQLKDEKIKQIIEELQQKVEKNNKNGVK